MRSRASLKGHPIHPILVGFPIAFFAGSLLFDVLSVVLEQASFSLTAKYLNVAGIVSGLAAAVPGIVDYLFTVPPESSGKKRAAKHGLLNTTALIIFAFALYFRGDQDRSAYLIPGLEAVGMILLGIAGWMGGTLVYRNQIGVDIRYADAGKWKEETVNESGTWIRVATKDELKPDQMKLIHIGNKRIALARTEGGYVAFDDRCTHRGGSLAGGSMMCGTVQCPWHGSQFDVKTGAVKAGPAKEPIHTYSIKEDEHGVFVSGVS